MTDRIEKELVLRAPKARVWRALSDSTEFATWFRMDIDGPFVPGKSVRGTLKAKGYEHLVFEMIVERVDPEGFFSYRWHPYALDAAIDYSKEPMTLVEFRLEETVDGTRLTVIESGFDKIPASRRDEAFRMNDKGWSGQLENVRRHVES